MGEMKTWTKLMNWRTIVGKLNLGANAVLLCHQRPCCPVEIPENPQAFAYCFARYSSVVLKQRRQSAEKTLNYSW